MARQSKDLVTILATTFLLTGTIACKEEPSGAKSSTSTTTTVRSRRPVVIDEGNTDNGSTTPTTSPITTTTTQPAGGGGGGGGGAAAPVLAGTYLGACSAGQGYYFRLKFNFSGTNVRLDEDYYNDAACAARLEGSIITGTSLVGVANGQGYNIDFAVARTGYYIAPSQNLATFNDPANPFCGRATGWVHGENTLEAGNPCRENLASYRVYNVNGTTLMMSIGAPTAAQRLNSLTQSFARQ